jgi:hypothetical protein
MDLIPSTVLPASAMARWAASSQLLSDCEMTSMSHDHVRQITEALARRGIQAALHLD